jgi:hypothetical protein
MLMYSSTRPQKGRECSPSASRTARDEPSLNLLPLLVAQPSQLVLRTIEASGNLVERVIRVLLKLFSNLLDLLVPPQPLLIFHLVQSALLELRVCGFEPSLRVSIYCFCGGGCDGEGVEGVVYACRVDCRAGLCIGWGGLVEGG